MDKYNKSVQHQWFHHATWGDSKYKNEGVGKVLWHSLTESGKVEIVKIKFGKKTITNIPTDKLTVVEMKEHSHEATEEDEEEKDDE